MNIYSDIVRPALFRLDAETAHHIAMTGLRLTPPVLLSAVFGKETRGQCANHYKLPLRSLGGSHTNGGLLCHAGAGSRDLLSDDIA